MISIFFYENELLTLHYNARLDAAISNSPCCQETKLSLWSHHLHLVISDVVRHHHNDMVIGDPVRVEDLVRVAHIGLRRNAIG